MPKWDGKSRGNALGYKIFIFALNRFGPPAPYFILYFVAFYFVFLSPSTTRAAYSFLRRRMQFSLAVSAFGVYRTYVQLGRSIIDKVAILGGASSFYSCNFDGEQHLQELVDRGEGGLLISAHLGNWDIAANFLGNLERTGTINVVAVDAEREQIRVLLEKHQSDKKFNIIPVEEDGSHIFGMYNALRNNELVCIHADRYMDRQKTGIVDFFNSPVRLPLGPFKIITKLRKPFTFVFAVKESASHYHFFSTEVLEPENDPLEIMKKYAIELEKKTRLYPYQWFNFYDFWEL